MQVPDTTPRESDADRETLEQQVRALQERLAFYEGFDRLIQDNVAHARELFRLAAQEREAAATAIDRARHEAGRREAHLRGELEQIAADLEQLSQIVETLSDRVARALGEPASRNGGTNAPWQRSAHRAAGAVVVHGVPSARTALSLQRFVASLPQVADVSAREFMGGVLRLDARVRDRLEVAQFLTWADARRSRRSRAAGRARVVLREPAVRVTRDGSGVARQGTAKLPARASVADQPHSLASISTKTNSCGLSLITSCSTPAWRA